MDKGLPLTISQVLLQQKRTLSEMKEATARLKENGVQLKETNSIFRTFLVLSNKLWDEQHKFNGIVVGELRIIVDELKSIKKKYS